MAQDPPLTPGGPCTAARHPHPCTAHHGEPHVDLMLLLAPPTCTCGALCCAQPTSILASLPLGGAIVTTEPRARANTTHRTGMNGARLPTQSPRRPEHLAVTADSSGRPAQHAATGCPVPSSPAVAGVWLVWKSREGCGRPLPALWGCGPWGDGPSAARSLGLEAELSLYSHP